MKFSNDPIDVLDVIRLITPIFTFAMGYLLTSINYKRNMKRVALKERFERFLHPFFLLLKKISQTENATGLSFKLDIDGGKAFFDFIFDHIYLSSAKTQKLFWKARELFFTTTADCGNITEDVPNTKALEREMMELIKLILEEYKRTALQLGYDFEETFQYSQYE